MDEEAGVIMDTPPAAAAGSMEIEDVAVVLLFPVVFVPDSVPVVSESVAVPVLVSLLVSVFVTVVVPVLVPVEVLEAVEASVVDSEVSAVAVSVVSESQVSIEYNSMIRVLTYLLAYPRRHPGFLHRAAMAKLMTSSPVIGWCRARSE